MSASAKHQSADFAIPPQCGEVRAHEALAPRTWLRLGGAAQCLVRVPDEAALARLLRAVGARTPLLVLGAGSNLLVRDGGVAGLVVRLGRGFQTITPLDEHRFAVGAAVLDAALARAALATQTTGLEFYSGIPGTLGGALAMNAGAYGAETAQCVERVEAYDRAGQKHELAPEDMGYAYRSCAQAGELVFTKAIMRGRAGARDAIAARLDEIARERQTIQPQKVRTGGSTFKNPGGRDGLKAWTLLDAAGMRGARLGAMQFSQQHCNFMLNLGGATAHEMETLAERARAKVRAQSGHELEWEIRRVGEPRVGAPLEASL